MSDAHGPRALSERAEAVARPPARPRAKSAQLSSEAWSAWLLSVSSTDESGTVRLAGRRLDETASRTLYRWCREGAAPTFWSADRFCCRVLACHINDYLTWAASKELWPWAGPEPWWETEPLTDADLAELDCTWPEPAPEPLAA